MWNVDSDDITIFSGHGDEVTCGNFTPDGNRVVTGSAD
jgi:angio-associated migratory cell protein